MIDIGHHQGDDEIIRMVQIWKRFLSKMRFIFPKLETVTFRKVQWKREQYHDPLLNLSMDEEVMRKNEAQLLFFQSMMGCEIPGLPETEIQWIESTKEIEAHLV